MYKATRQEVYSAIDGERDYQKGLWGDTAGERGVGDYLVYMQEYMRRAMEAKSTQVGEEAALHMIRKVTALGVACLEWNGAPKREG